MSICCHDMSVCLDPSDHEINPHSHGQNISSLVSVKYLVAVKSRLIDRELLEITGLFCVCENGAS